jgi:Rho-binding antiterminator
MQSYTPIDCNFYDKLEAFATRKRFIRIQYFTLIHEFQTVDAIIKDFYIKNGYEYMQLNNGVEIRLDLLISADNQFVPGKGFDGISCECD